MKKIRTLLKWGLAGICLLYALMLLFPQFLFAHKLEHGNFSVYYHEQGIDADQLKTVLDQAQALIEQADVYEADLHQRIFLCSSHGEFAFFAPTSRRSFAVNYPVTQHIFLSRSSVSGNSIVRNGEANNQRNLSGVIAHETTHSLLENHLGLMAYKFLPTWKNEGYCDFIARESSFDAEQGWNVLCAGSEDMESASFRYFHYRMRTEYLFQERGVSLESFLQDEFDLEALDQDLKEKHCTREDA